MKTEKIFLILIPLIILILTGLSHEMGHYYISKQNDLNPKLKLFSADNNTSIFVKGILSVSYNGTVSGTPEEVNLIKRKIDIAGHSFEIIFLSIVTLIALVIAYIRKEWLLFALIGGMFIVLIGLVLGWNIFYISPSGDLFKLLV